MPRYVIYLVLLIVTLVVLAIFSPTDKDEPVIKSVANTLLITVLGITVVVLFVIILSKI